MGKLHIFLLRKHLPIYLTLNVREFYFSFLYLVFTYLCDNCEKDFVVKHTKIT